jgi:hypothetical protein
LDRHQCASIRDQTPRLALSLSPFFLIDIKEKKLLSM